LRVSSLGANYKPSFGYSKKANDRLKKVVEQNESSTKKGTIEYNVLQLQAMCNDTEDFIKKSRIMNMRRAEGIDVLLQSKVLLAKLVTTYFPNLKFQAEELEHYRKKGDSNLQNGISDSDNWEMQLADELDVWDGDSLEDDETDSPKPIVKSLPPANTNATGTSESARESLLEEFVPTESSPRGFIDIAGMDELKKTLTEAIINPLKDPESAKLDFQEYGKKYPKGVLLYGPPGCGKTYITEALAQETGLPMFILKIGKVGAIHIHETSQNYEKAFEQAAKKAKETGKPCLLFMDEIEAVTKDRVENDRKYELEEMSSLLKLMETARDRNIIIIGATNKFNLVDNAIKRRLKPKIYVGLPDNKTREAILLKKLSSVTKGSDLKEDKESIDTIVKKLEGFSNDNICDIADQAADKARLEGRRNVMAQDYYDVIASEEVQLMKLNERDYKPRADAKVGFR